VEGGDRHVGRAEGSRDRGRGSGIIPVGATNNNGVGTIVGTREAEVVAGERTVWETDIAEVSSNGAVEANLVTRGTVEVTAEEVKAGAELLKDDGLSLNLADLLEDDPLGHLLEDEQALLDDLDGLSVADDLGLLFDGLAEVDRAIEVVYSVEVVEATEG